MPVSRCPRYGARPSCPLGRSETLGAPEVYGDDRVFVRLSSGADAGWQTATDATLASLASAGQPVLDLTLGAGVCGLGAAFSRWGCPTAHTRSATGITPAG